jgi:hypothetical protein
MLRANAADASSRGKIESIDGFTPPRSTNAVALEEATPLPSPTGDEISTEEIIEMIRNYFESLAADTFPTFARSRMS